MVAIGRWLLLAGGCYRQVVAIASCKCKQLYTKLCPGSAPGAGHSALTQQNVHSWGKYCHCTQHTIRCIGNAITVWLGTYSGVVNEIIIEINIAHDCDI